MAVGPIQTVRSLPRYAGTRRVMTAQVVGRLLILVLVMVRCSTGTLAQDAPPDAEPVFTGETFLAETRAGLFLAVIIGDGDAETTNRPARAFVCEDQRLGQWFTGELVGDELTLRPEPSEREATPQPDTRLIGTLSAGRVTGEVVQEGQTVMFAAAPAASLGGYWEGVRPPGGLVLARSSTGAQYLGQAPPTTTETADGPLAQIEGIVTLLDGSQLPLILNAEPIEEAIFRTVVLNDGRHCVLR